MEFNVILNAFNKEQFAQVYLYEFVFAFDKDMRSAFKFFQIGVLCTFVEGKPFVGSVGSSEKLVVVNRFEQVVDSIVLVTLNCILLVGGYINCSTIIR